jgi:hypothetical protein
MKNKIKSSVVTINLQRKVWEDLQMIKIKGGYNSLNEVIKILLGKK